MGLVVSAFLFFSVSTYALIMCAKEMWQIANLNQHTQSLSFSLNLVKLDPVIFLVTTERPVIQLHELPFVGLFLHDRCAR